MPWPYPCSCKRGSNDSLPALAPLSACKRATFAAGHQPTRSLRVDPTEAVRVLLRRCVRRCARALGREERDRFRTVGALHVKLMAAPPATLQASHSSRRCHRYRGRYPALLGAGSGRGAGCAAQVDRLGSTRSARWTESPTGCCSKSSRPPSSRARCWTRWASASAESPGSRAGSAALLPRSRAPAPALAAGRAWFTAQRRSANRSRSGSAVSRLDDHAGRQPARSPV